jgi:hypothetical protein
VDDHEDLRSRIEDLCARADQPGGEDGLTAEMNALLSEGYARALLAEHGLTALGAEERQAAARAILRLRAGLSAMHERFLTISAR